MKANQYVAKFIETLDILDQQGENISGLILSHPGFGKTSTIRKYCKYKDYNLETIIPSQSAADDILGLQSVKDGVLTRLTPSWFNKLEKTMENGKRTLLFIDEISTCDPYIQGPLLDLIFSRNLGERHLPDNVFIVSAGNYSGDLEGEFRMSSPLVNRFMILNLLNEDFSIREFFSDGNKFEELEDEDNIKNFLGLEEISRPSFDFNKLKNWIRESHEVSFERTLVEEDEECGVLGFTSIRSLSYSLKFANAYFTRFEDDLWARIIGDTLGTSAKKEDIPLSKSLKVEIDKGTFDYKMSKNCSETFSEVLKRIVNEGLNNDNIKDLESAVNRTPASDITSEDIKLFIKIMSPQLRDDSGSALSEAVRRINNKIFKKGIN